MRQIIKKLLIESKTTALIVTHDIYDAMEFSDRLIVLEKGHIIQEGVPNEVFKNPNSKETALLFGKANFICRKMNWFFPTVNYARNLTSITQDFSR